MPQISLSKTTASDVLFSMGAFGVLLFAPAYFLLQKGLIEYKSLLLFESIFFANPHLLASFLRAYTDKNEIQRYKIYTIILPIILFLTISFYIWRFGLGFLWVLGSIYFYWQWWHHARQSFGLGRKNQSSLKNFLSPFDLKLNDLAIWSVAICGITLKSSSARDYYEGIPIRTLHLPDNLLNFVLAGATSICFGFVLRQIWLFKNKQLIQSEFLTYWLIHSFVFICFFGLLPTDLGIIAASFWHCTQYMSHVRNHQEVKVQNGVLPQAIWKILYSKENWLTFTLLLTICSLIIPALKLGLSNLHINALIFGLSLTITFHHYILDAVLWTSKEVNWSLNRSTNTQ